MSPENKEILDRINKYAEEVLADIDPQKVQVSVQLEKLKPIMEEIAKEKNMDLSDVFILYMDLASEAGVQRQKDFEDEYNDIAPSFSQMANKLQ